jgi:hypothetical protein
VSEEQGDGWAGSIAIAIALAVGWRYGWWRR